MNTQPDRAAFAYVGAFVDEIAKAGVRHVCVSPGSRSTPLALTIANHPAIRTWMHIDERSGAFFALGLARGLGEPVALLCTSGTAAANFFPAVVEARAAGVPLLVLTADRPPELRDVGAAQAIDQNRLFGTHAKWFVEVAIPEATPELLRYARTLAARAVALASAVPAGPVHLNFPFREPLIPAPWDTPDGVPEAEQIAWDGRPEGARWVTVTDSALSLDIESAQRLAERVRAATRPLIVCGPQQHASLAAPLTRLARLLGAPLLVDPLSQLRWGTHDRAALIDRYDSALRREATASALVPDLVIRIGGVPTSKALLQYLQRHASAPLLVIDEAMWPDPTLLAEEIVHADPRVFCQSVFDILSAGSANERASNEEWLASWRAVDDAAGKALSDYANGLDEPFEGGALADVMSCLPDCATLFVSSSMPVRDLDAFCAGDDRNIRVLANRGANGIDGVVSSALGAAAAASVSGGGPLVLVIGDLALYHDMNGLLAARLYGLDATVVVINNDGGGIFSFLPQAAHPLHFERLFGTPHGLTFAPVAELYGARYHSVHDSASLLSAVAAGVSGSGLHIVELCTDRARNVELHHHAWEAVARALSNL